MSTTTRPSAGCSGSDQSVVSVMSYPSFKARMRTARAIVAGRCRDVKLVLALDYAVDRLDHDRLARRRRLGSRQ